MRRLDPNTHRLRRSDVEKTVTEGGCFETLSKMWGVSVPATWNWCQKNTTEDECAQLAQNGRLRAGKSGPDWERRTLHTEDRLALIDLCMANGWTLSRIGSAIGLSKGALYGWVERNAPDGVKDALSDFEKDLAA
jgi:transposase